MDTSSKVPKLWGDSFICPHCSAFASQDWFEVARYVRTEKRDFLYDVDLYQNFGEWKMAVCAGCGEPSVWNGDRMVYPSTGNAPPPHPDIPDEVASIYLEAKEVSGQSPRAAAALLRLALQELCKELGGKGKNINDDIATFVKNGMPVEVQKALDVVRVVGNNAVHPGEINLNDTPEITGKLFGLINFIVEDRITRPRELESLYEIIPESQREAIKKRDGNSDPK